MRNTTSNSDKSGTTQYPPFATPKAVRRTAGAFFRAFGCETVDLHLTHLKSNTYDGINILDAP
jgi:hypothetical protein